MHRARQADGGQLVGRHRADAAQEGLGRMFLAQPMPSRMWRPQRPAPGFVGERGGLAPGPNAEPRPLAHTSSHCGR